MSRYTDDQKKRAMVNLLKAVADQMPGEEKQALTTLADDVLAGGGPLKGSTAMDNELGAELSGLVATVLDKHW